MEKQLVHGMFVPQSAWDSKAQTILPEPLLKIVARLHREFNPGRLVLLRQRQERQKAYDKGELPAYGPRDSQAVSGQWKVAAVPGDLQVRRVEITGPVNDPKMVINMLSRNPQGHRADTAMLDFEDSMKPSWKNVLDGISNVLGVARGDLQYSGAGKTYRLDTADMAVPMVRVRGLHLNESNIVVDGVPVSAGLLDLTACAFHTARLFVDQARTPKFYVPKCEHHLEAHWWNKLFTAVEQALDLWEGTIKCTFLIETLPAAFQVEEILYELRGRAVGLNVGRWDKIFSDIKVLREHKNRLSPDRAQITMKSPWMDNYAKRLIKICHERGAYAVGGMSAFTPGKDATLREAQTMKVLLDKQREFSQGHDGCWVSHPYFIGTALQAFTQESQLEHTLPDFDKYPDLLMQGGGERSMQGLRTNLRVGIAYMQGWARDIGCVSWDNLMEDLATLEISRAQTWQWLHHEAELKDGTQVLKVTKDLVKKTFDEELAKIQKEVRAESAQLSAEDLQKLLATFEKAKDEALAIFLSDTLKDFLTLESDRLP